MRPLVLTVNFHPDRLLPGGTDVVSGLVADGEYHHQFRTGISNGGLGAERAAREDLMFPGRARPVYGAVNLAGHRDGASPRFGSCHLVLSPAVSSRATFSPGDSYVRPEVAPFEAIWAGLLARVETSGQALGLSAPSADAWVAALDLRRPGPGRALDDYVEAQIHGGLRLASDVTAVVADGSFRGTRFEPLLERLGPSLAWVPSFRLPPSGFPADLRGPAVPLLASSIAGRYGVDLLDAEVIGRAAREPASWASFGDVAEVLQLIKYLWHILVLRGSWEC